MKEFLHAYPPVAVAMYTAMGLLFFVFSFWLIDKVTPGQLWKEIIEEKNVAASMVVAASLVGMSIIIASCIVGG